MTKKKVNPIKEPKWEVEHNKVSIALFFIKFKSNPDSYNSESGFFANKIIF